MSAALYLLAWAGTLADQLGGWRGAGLAAGPAVFLFLAIELRRQGRALRVVFLGLSAAGAVAAFCASDPLAALLEGGRRGAAYAAFFLALGTLRQAAEGSARVQRCGAHLAGQAAGRGTAAMLAGGHVFGIILSYGAIDLLGAMAARAQGAARRAMVLAAFRGFAVMNCWSPLNIMTVVVAAAVPAAPMRLLLPVGLAAALAMLGIAWAMGRGGGAGAASGERWTVHLPVLGLVGLVFVLAEAVALGFGVALATGVTAAVPVVALAWMAGQGGIGARLVAFAARVPGFRGEAALLAAGGFLGVTLGLALPAGGIAPALSGLPPVLLPLLVGPLLVGTGILGLNPIAVVAALGATVPDPAALGVAPAVLALACMLGWGVGVGMSPMSASAMATARWTGSTPWQVTAGWNRGFTLACLLLAESVVVVAHLTAAGTVFTLR